MLIDTEKHPESHSDVKAADATESVAVSAVQVGVGFEVGVDADEGATVGPETADESDIVVVFSTASGTLTDERRDNIGCAIDCRTERTCMGIDARRRWPCRSPVLVSATLPTWLDWNENRLDGAAADNDRATGDDDDACGDLEGE